MGNRAVCRFKFWWPSRNSTHNQQAQHNFDPTHSSAASTTHRCLATTQAATAETDQDTLSGNTLNLQLQARNNQKLPCTHSAKGQSPMALAHLLLQGLEALLEGVELRAGPFLGEGLLSRRHRRLFCSSCPFGLCWTSLPVQRTLLRSTTTAASTRCTTTSATSARRCLTTWPGTLPANIAAETQ